MKICIVVSSLGTGGAERSSALLSKLLANSGYDVHIVSVLNDIDYDYSGALLNLGALKDKDDSFFGRIKRLMTFKKYLNTHRFDYIVDSRSRPTIFKEILISKFLYRSFKCIYIVRSNKLNTYLGNNKTISKHIYGKAHTIVAVSNETKLDIENQYQLSNVTTIHNSVDLYSSDKELLMNDGIKGAYILFFGRLNNDIKNISLLIDGYKNSKLLNQNIRLLILGDGKDKQMLKNKVEAEDLEQFVIFKPFIKDPYAIIKNALFTVLTSKYEGFPRVLIESLAIGTPVISVDCSSGPKEIIQHGINGLLVKNHDAEALSEAMNDFTFNQELYNRCKNNSKKSVRKFSMDNIAEKWKQLLENTIP